MVSLFGSKNFRARDFRSGVFHRGVFGTLQRCIAASVCAILLSFAPGISQTTATPAQAQINKCGNLNQRSCTIADPIYYRRGACKPGLQPTTVLGGKCSKTKDSVLKDVRNAIKTHDATITNVARTWSACFTPESLMKVAGSQDQFFNAIASSPCLANVLQAAKDAGFGHVAIGTSASLGLGVGGDVETGFAFDVQGRRAPVFYQTRGITFFTVGGGGSVVINLGQGPATVANLQGNEHGASVGFAAFGGGGATASFSYRGQLQSVGIILTTGVKGELGYVRTNTIARSTGHSPPRIVAATNSDDQGGYSELPPVQEYAASERPTKLRFCNNTPFEHIYAGFSFWDDGSAMGRAGWSAKGWKKIKQGKCKTTSIPNDTYGYAYSGDVYVFASAEGAWWGKNSPAMCVSTPESDIPLRLDNVDRGCPSESDVYFDTGTYEFVDLPPSTDNTFTFSGQPDYRPQQRSTSAYSVTLCNRTTSDTIFVALGIEGRSRSYAQGWWEVGNGDCKTIDQTSADGSPYGGKIWAFATDGTQQWSGMGKTFCVRHPHASPKISDTQGAPCNRPEQFRLATMYLGDLNLQANMRLVFEGPPTLPVRTNGAIPPR